MPDEILSGPMADLRETLWWEQPVLNTGTRELGVIPGGEVIYHHSWWERQEAFNHPFLGFPARYVQRHEVISAEQFFEILERLRPR